MCNLIRRRPPAVQGLLWALALCAALTPVVAGASPPEAGPADEAAVRKVLDGLIEALSAADVKGFTSLFAPDATMFFPLPSLPLRLEDRAQIATAFGAFFDAIRRREPGPPYMDLVASDTRVQLFGDAAVVTFHLKGGDMISRRTLVLQKRSGAWLIVHLHASNVRLPRE